jgi:hypothetical protein
MYYPKAVQQMPTDGQRDDEKSYILLKSGNAREHGHFRDFADYRTVTCVVTRNICK